jgi:hypothetical protein
MEKNAFDVSCEAVATVGVNEEADCCSLCDHSFVCGVSVKITLTLTVD